MSSRASSASVLRPRETMYQAGALPRSTHQPHTYDFAAQVRSIVQIANECTERAHAITVNYDEAIGDIPRLARVLANKRMHVMVSQSTIDQYKAQTAEEIEPQISELVQRGDAALVALEKRRAHIRRKVDAAATAGSTKDGTGKQTIMDEKRRAQLKKANQELERHLAELEEEVKDIEAELAQHNGL